jgi:hypothetical protein
MLQAARSRDQISLRWIFFNFVNPSSRSMALESTQPLTKMSTRNLFGGKGRPALKADNLTAIYEPIVYKLWEPQNLTTLWASTACYRDTYPYLNVFKDFVISSGYIWSRILFKGHAEHVNLTLPSVDGRDFSSVQMLALTDAVIDTSLYRDTQQMTRLQITELGVSDLITATSMKISMFWDNQPTLRRNMSRLCLHCWKRNQHETACLASSLIFHPKVVR